MEKSDKTLSLFSYTTPPDYVDFFREDFQYLYHYKEYMLKDVELDAHNTGTALDVRYCNFDDNRSFRRTYPHGKQKVRQFLENQKTENDGGEKSRVYFVGFFGMMKESERISQDVIKEVWDIDNVLIQELTNHPHMLFYGTCQLTPEGDYFNLVLFESDEAVTHWRKANGHDRAVGIAPDYYEKLHIHMGELLDGLQGQTYQLWRTTFINYSGPKPARLVRQWRDMSENIIEMKTD